MADNFFKISKGVTLTPQTAEPTGQNGDSYYNSALSKFRFYENGVWKSLGGSSGINYITNPDAEGDTSGWATYADAAASSPVDGTGGAANITLTRTTSSPLRGTGSFLITKDAANRQGQGVSAAFTIDAADQGQVVRISADYSVASGTFSYGDGTVAVPSDLRLGFIYDVTNSLLIEPSATLLNGSGKFVTEFQASSNSTSYRLIFHVATTSASAWTFKFDNVQVGPRDVARGAIITDWAAHTPSDSTYAWGTTSARSFMWKRDGDTITVKAYVTLSSVVTGNLIFTPAEYLPPGLSVDTAKLLTVNTDCTWYALDDSAGSTSDEVQGVGAAGSNGNLFFMMATTDITVGEQLDATVPFTWASADSFGFTVKVPVLGWASNTVTSADSGTRTVAFSVVDDQPSSSAFDGTANVIWPALSERFRDTHAMYNATTGIVTIPESGWYGIFGQVTVTGTEVANATKFLEIYLNGTRIMRNRSRIESATNLSSTSVNVQHLDYFNAGDQISLRLVTDMAGPGFDANAAAHAFSVHKIQSPQSIGMADFVGCRYTTNAGQSIPTGASRYPDFEDKDYDSHNMAVGAGSGISTTFNGGFYVRVPVSGKYRCKVTNAISSANFATSERIEIGIQTNGTDVKATNTVGGTGASNFTHPEANAVLNLNAGDIVSFLIFQNSGGAETLHADGDYNYIEVTRIG